MAHTLAISGCVTRSDTATYTLMDLNITQAVDEQIDQIVEIAGLGTLNVQMAALTTGQWLGLRVVTASKDVDVTLNGADNSFRTRDMALNQSNITSLTLENPDAAVITVQFVLGGT